MSDIRAMAYVLATAARESKRIKQYDLPKLDRAGAPELDKKTGLPLMRHPKLWTVFQPIEESGHGAGRRHHDPVKVAVNGTGALVTERDGEQFDVAAHGTYKIADGTSKKSGAWFGSWHYTENQIHKRHWNRTRIFRSRTSATDLVEQLRQREYRTRS